MKTVGLVLIALMTIAIPASDPTLSAEERDLTSKTHRTRGWSRDFTIAGFMRRDGVAPTVYDFALGPDGRVLASGFLRWFGKRRIDPVVRLDDDGWRSLRDDWGRKLPRIFTAVAASQTGDVALSTYGGRYGGPVEIWLATASGVEIIGNLFGAVRSMVWFEGRLWVAGHFLIEETGLSHLAVWDGSTWAAPPGGPADGAVYRLVVDQDALLMGGGFTNIGGIAARRVAEWDGTDWTAYDLENALVYSVARSRTGELFAGGLGGLFRWTGAGWETVGGGLFYETWTGPATGVVTDAVMHQGDLYVTGCFSHVGAPPSEPGSIRAESIARWTGAQWESLDDGSRSTGSVRYDPGICAEGGPFAIWDMKYQRLFSDGERVLLGGGFSGVAGVPSQSIAQFDANGWSAFGQTRDGLLGAPDAIAVGGSRESVYILGEYVSHAGTTPKTSGVFRYARTRSRKHWIAVGGPLPSDVIWCDRFAVDRRNRVFVGCGKRSAPWIPVVLMLDGSRWVRIASLGVEGPIEDMQIDARGRLWVAGGLEGEGAPGPESGYVARLDGHAFTIVEDGFNATASHVAFPPVGARRGRAVDVIVAGAFTRIGADAYTRVARLREGRWETLGAGFSTNVTALAWGRNAVYASTAPPTEPGAERLLLARWDGTHWKEIATPENGFPPPVAGEPHWILDLLAYRGHLIAAGSVWSEAGGLHVLIYDRRRQRFDPLGGGVSAMYVSSIARSRDGLWFVGFIAAAGSGNAQVPSIGIANFRHRGGCTGHRAREVWSGRRC